jgi:hypothetical protein
MLGRLDGPAVVRPPLAKLGAAELQRIRSAIDAAELHEFGAVRLGQLPAAAE